MDVLHKLKQRAGVLLIDIPRYLFLLGDQKNGWIKICNRTESIRCSSETGAFCDWKWSSILHAPRLVPWLGKQIAKQAFKEFPIQLSDSVSNRKQSVPDVSFLIGHRGTARLPHLLLTLESIAAQKYISFECIVVEQSLESEIELALPSWVRYYHTRNSSEFYNRAKTFNAAYAKAKGKVLILHDNDMLVPTNYAKDIFEKFEKGYEVINLKRFIFYLNENSTREIFEEGMRLSNMSFESIVQNLEAGGSIGISKQAYKEIGGLDESFVGWGGEDNEFWERALTKRVWNYTYMPIVHLWHAPQSGKTSAKDTPAVARYQERSLVSVGQRIDELSVLLNEKSVIKQ